MLAQEMIGEHEVRYEGSPGEPGQGQNVNLEFEVSGDHFRGHY